MVMAYLLAGLAALGALWAACRMYAEALREPDEALSRYPMAARITYPAIPRKAQQTWRRNVRIYINTRKGEL